MSCSKLLTCGFKRVCMQQPMLAVRTTGVVINYLLRIMNNNVQVTQTILCVLKLCSHLNYRAKYAETSKGSKPKSSLLFKALLSTFTKVLRVEKNRTVRMWWIYETAQKWVWVLLIHYETCRISWWYHFNLPFHERFYVVSTPRAQNILRRPWPPFSRRCS